MDKRRFEIRRSDTHPGGVRISSQHVCLYEVPQAQWSGGGQTTLVDVEGRCAAVLSQPPLGPDVVLINRPGHRPVSVRRAFAPHGTGQWSVDAGDSLPMSVWGDMLAVRAVLQQGDRVVADVTAEGGREYVVTCVRDVDPVLVLSIVFAVDHLGH